MNEDIVKGKWSEIKGEIVKTWGKLTDDELTQSKGNVATLTGLIQQKYGTAKEQISEELHKLFDRFGSQVNEKAEVAEDYLRDEPKKEEKWQ